MALKDLLNADIQNYYLNYPFQNEFNYGAGTKVSGGVFDQKSQKFGQGKASDQPKGGFSNQPYIQTPIPEGDDNYNFLPIGGSQVLNIIDTVTDGLVRGGLITATAHSATDIVRLSRFGIDVLRGPAFIAKQIGLQRSNVKFEAPNSLPNFNSNRLYNLGVNTVAQAGVNAFGIHFKRHGAFPQIARGEEDPTGYADIIKGNFLTKDNNRLVSFKENLDLGNPDKFYLENKFNTQTEKQLYDYSGGPGSVYGIGRTKIFSYTNTNPVLPPDPPIIPSFSSNETPTPPVFPGYGIPKYISDNKSDSLLYRKDPFPFGNIDDSSDANHKIYFPITGLWGDRENNLDAEEVANPVSENYTTLTGVKYIKGNDNVIPDKLKIIYDDEGYTVTGRPSHTVKIGNFSPGGSGDEMTNYPATSKYIKTVEKEVGTFDNTVFFQSNTPGNLFLNPETNPISISYTTKLDSSKLRVYEGEVGKPSHTLSPGNFNGEETNFIGALKVLPITNYKTYPFNEEKLGDSIEIYKPSLSQITENFSDKDFTVPTYTTLLNYSKTDGGLRSTSGNNYGQPEHTTLSQSPYYGGDNPLQRIGGEDFYKYTRASYLFNKNSSDPDKGNTVYDNVNLDFTKKTYTTSTKSPINLSEYDGSLKPLKVKSSARMFNNRFQTNSPKTKLTSIKNIDIERKRQQWAKSEDALAEGAYDVNIYNYLSLDNPVLNSDRSPVSPTISVDPLKASRQPVGLVGQKLALGELKDFRRIKGGRNAGSALGKYYQQMSSNYGTSNMETRLKIGTGFDAMNRLPIIRHLVGDKPDSKSGKGTRDLIKFFIEAVDNDDPGVSDTLFFRAYLSSFNDNYSSKWDSYNFVGNPEKFYNYNSFDRDISLSFIISANSKEELRPMYVKLNALISNLMPDYQKGNTRARAPYIKLNVGSYLNRVPGFIESLGIKWDTEYPWEIGINKPDGTITKELQVLPHVLSIDLKFKPIHNFIPRKMTVCDPDVPFITLNTRVGDAPGGPEQYFIGDGKESGVIKEGTHLFGGKGTGNYTISGDAPGCITPPKPDPLPPEPEPEEITPIPIIPSEPIGTLVDTDTGQRQEVAKEERRVEQNKAVQKEIDDNQQAINDEKNKENPDEEKIDQLEKDNLNKNWDFQKNNLEAELKQDIINTTVVQQKQISITEKPLYILDADGNWVPNN